MGTDPASSKENFGNQVNHGIMLDEYINFDIGASTVRGILTNQEILAEVNEVVEEDSDVKQNENDDGESVAKPGIKEVRKEGGHHLENLQKNLENLRI